MQYRLLVLGCLVNTSWGSLLFDAHCKNLIVAGLFFRIPDLTHFFVLGSYLDQRTLKGKIKLTEKMMLERVKMEVEKRIEIKMIRNLALQSDLEPQNQVAYRLIDNVSLLWALFLAVVICWFAVISWQHKLDLFSIEFSIFFLFGCFLFLTLHWHLLPVGSRGTERTVVMDKSKGVPVISVKTSGSKERVSIDFSNKGI